MATLAMGVAGAIIGGLLSGGNPLAINAGFIAGSILGQILFPTKSPDQPHYFNPDVSASTYGIPIPIAWGTIRLPGNMIWSIPIQEVAQTQSSGKGGLGGNSQTTYTYFCSFAFAFCKGPAADVLRMWADGKLVYDKNNVGSLQIDANGVQSRVFLPTPNNIGTFRFYPGNETQIADSLIDNNVGTGNESAHRGLCYIVFENIPLANYGNRIPSLTAEITMAVTEGEYIRYSNDITFAKGGVFGTNIYTEMAYDSNRGLIYTISTYGSGGFRIFDFNTLTEVRQQVDTTLFGGGLMVGDSGYIYHTANITGRPIYKVDPNSLGLVASSGALDASTFESYVELSLAGTHFLVCIERFSGVKTLVLNADTMATIVEHDYADDSIMCGVTKGDTLSSNVNAYSIRQIDHDDGNSPVTISQVSCALSGVSFTDLATIPSTTWSNNGNGASAVVFNQSDSSLLFWITRLDTTGSYLIKWKNGTGVEWVTETGTGAPDNYTMSESSKLTGNNIGWTDGVTFTLIDISTGNILLNALAASTISPGGSSWGFGGSYGGVQFFDGNSDSVIICPAIPSVLGQAFLRVESGTGVTVEQIVEDVSAIVGLSATDDINATTLTDVVRGYACVQQTTAAQAISPLGSLFFFDGVETDGKVVFIKRGQSVSFAHIQDDLILPSDPTQGVVTETRIQEVELPERIALSYMDYDQDYQPGTAPARRTREPTPTMRSRETQTTQVPIVFSASQDAPTSIVERLLYTIWEERTSYDWHAPFDAITINPADVGTITLNDNSVITARIVKSIINADLSVSLSGVKQGGFTYASSGTTGQGNLGYPQPQPRASNATILFLLDVPLLRDIDDTLGASDRLYIGMNGYNSPWGGGFLWDSLTGDLFSQTTVSLGVGTAYGTVQTALPDTTTPSETDYTHTIHAYMGVGTLSSVTYDEFINGDNAAIVGSPILQNWEIILFQNADQQTDGSYILSNIIRGRRGTEFRTGTHVTGEQIVFLTRASMTSYLLANGTIGATRFYKGVGQNQLPEDAQTLSLASTGAPMKPWTVADVGAAISGSDVVITWNRRDRLGSGLVGGTIPMSELTESYEIDILSGTGGTVKRTLTATAGTVTYLAANITTDFGSIPATLYFRVYQISAVVGRGYSVESAITF